MTMGDQQQQQLHLQQQQQQMAELPPGFRFHPTDLELINCYLVPKVLDRAFRANAVGEVDLNKCEPWELPEKANMGEKEWYFYCHKDRKYPTGMRTNRATDAGYWKATGKDKEIYRPAMPPAPVVLVGMKKTLVFYKGRAPRGEKTNWVMHEYRLEGERLPLPYTPPTATTINPSSSKDEWVVCRIFHKSSGIKKAMPSYAMNDQIRINTNPMAMAMSIPMPIGEQQGFTLNPAAFTLPPLMDPSSLYAAGGTSMAAPPASSYQMHAGPSMANAALPMNAGHYFGNNHQMAAAAQAPTMFYQQPQMQIGAEGFMAAEPASGPSSLMSNEDTTELNNNEQNNAAAVAAAEISSVDMGMDGMWKY